MDAQEQRRLLELAAKAIGFDLHINLVGASQLFKDGEYVRFWKPHDDDGDSRRLEVKLGIQVTPYPIYDETKHSVLARKCRLGSEDNGIGEPDTDSLEWIELYGGDPCAATRLAVLRVAAAIGERMETKP